MAIIEKKSNDGSIRFLVRVRDIYGGWYKSKTFEKKSDAKRYERNLQNEKDAGALAQNKIQKALTFSEYWNIWFSDCRHEISEGWKNTQKAMVGNHIMPYLGDKKLHKIDQLAIGRILGKMTKDGLKPQTRLHIYSILRKVFEDAHMVHCLIGKNPVTKRFRPKVFQKERDFLEPDESWRMLKVSKDTWMGPAIWLALLSGLRISEIIALRWEAVSFHNRQILIKAAFKKSVNRIEPYPKQKNWGLAPMPAPLVEYLLELSGGKKSNDFVATGKFGGMINYRAFHRSLQVFCKNNGFKSISPHELRHSCTELYIEAGASAEDIRRLLNQKDFESTARYIHRTNRRLSSIADNLQPKNLQLEFSS